MIRYELYSNLTGSEQGLRGYPELEDLVDTLRVGEIEPRFVRQVFKEEEQINLAAGKHARGVTVRSTSTREVSAEASLRGCLNWLRAMAGRPTRAMHLHVTKFRATNGAAMLFPRLLREGQRVFVSGLADDAWVRITTTADLTCKTIPAAIKARPALLQDYLARASRPTGFINLLQRLAPLEVLAPEAQAAIKAVLTERKPEALKKLTPEQIVNLGIIDEVLERCERLAQQFVELLLKESALGELPNLFDLLTQGAPFDELRKRFAPFALEEKRERIRDKRVLVNEIRIGLSRREDSLTDEFLRLFTGVVLRMRVRLEPQAYARVTRLDAVDPALVGAMAEPRRLFIEMSRIHVAGRPESVQPTDFVPEAIKVALFELAVSMTFQGRFDQDYLNQTQPPAVVVARNLLSCFIFSNFDLGRIRNLHPKLPVRGVARNLSDKVPLTWEELDGIEENLWFSLYPMGEVARELAGALRTRFKDEDTQRRVREVGSYLVGSTGQVTAMNYVLGRSGLNPLLWRAALAAGKSAGLSMLESRDQIRHREHLEIEGLEDEGHLGGYQLLMTRDDSRLFPLQAHPAHLARAYRHLYLERVAMQARRYITKKLDYLFALHGSHLFEVLYNHLQWEHRLTVSREQLAHLLELSQVFDKARLKEFGYDAISEERRKGGENPWLASALSGSEEGAAGPFAVEHLQKNCSGALAAFKALLGSYPAPSVAADGVKPTVGEVLAALGKHECFDPQHPDMAPALAGSDAAEALALTLGQCVAEQGASLLAGQELGQALELVLPGPLAYLTLLGRNHDVDYEHSRIRLRLMPGLALEPNRLDGASQIMVAHLSEQLGRGGAGGVLRQAVQMLQMHDQTWQALSDSMLPPLLDQALRETVLFHLKPTPPAPTDLKELPDEEVMCLATSSFDQAKFSKIVRHPEKRDVFATLSELASWLLRFRRLREELEVYREVVADLREIIAALNMSTFDAPYVTQLSRRLGELDTALDLRPEEITLSDLEAIESKAREISGHVIDAFDLERSVALKDRWMSRISMRLRRMHPHLRLNFVNQLFEGSEAAQQSAKPEEGEKQAPAKRAAKDYQTFSERVRTVAGFRERLVRKKVFVLSPNSTQRNLTLTLLDHLQRFKGVHTPILVDVSGCDSFIDDLQSRLPPHRMFDLGEV